MSKPYSIHRITVDVPNPSYDGRCKHGIESVKIFKAGTLVAVYEWINDKPWQVNIPFGSQSRIIIGDVAQSLHDSLIDAKPENVSEAIFVRGASSYGMSEDLLQSLFDNGDITIDQIDAAITRVFAKWDAEG